MSSNQSHSLHRALLRPMVLHTLRAAGFHSTKPSVLDTLVNITERYLLLLASTTAKHALNSHNDAEPTIGDVRMALRECGVLVPFESSGEEGWRETLRRPGVILGEEAKEVVERRDGAAKSGLAAAEDAARARREAEGRKRDADDLRDVRSFARWVDGEQYAEIKRIAGLSGDSVTGPAAGAATGAAAAVSTNGSGTQLTAVGLGGGKVPAEDFLEKMKKRHFKAVTSAAGGEDSRFHGTVLGKRQLQEFEGDEKAVVLEGGPVQHLRDWRPRLETKTELKDAQSAPTLEEGMAMG